MSSVTNDRLIVAVKKEDGTISKTITDIPLKDLISEPEPGKPLAQVKYEPLEPQKGDMVSLDGLGSKPGRPTATITDYIWSSPDVTITILQAGKGQFVFPDKSEVSITLKVRDSDNLEASATGIIKAKTEEPNKPEAIIEPRNPEGKKNQEINLESKSKNYTRLLWSTSTKLVIKDGIKDQPKVTIILPATIESGLNVDLKASNDNNDEDNDSIEITMVDDEPQPGNEVKIPITGSVASAQDSGKESTKAHDGDMESRWSADGKGAFIELNFDKVYKLTKVKLTGFHYDKAYMFQIAGKDFTNSANRAPNTLQEFNISDLALESNKLKIVGNGNSGSTYNSYREIEVYGIAKDGPQPVECPDPNQCKDVTTQQCRAIGANEEKGPDGYCKLKDIPQPGTETLVNRVIAFADNDTTTAARQGLQQMFKIPGVTQYCFVGDGPYSSRGTAWVNMMKEFFNTEELMNKLLIYRGNHDTSESESIQTQKDINAWFGRYTTPDGLWLHARQVGNVYFLVMDTQDPDVNFRDRTQHKFVTEKIAEAKQLFTDKKINWIVAGSHKPWFTLKGSSSHDPYVSVRNLYMALFKNFVDQNLHGHNHNFQYWKPMIPNESDINGEGTELFSLLPDGKTLDFDKERGWPTTIVGGSGHEWNKINDGPGIPHVWHHRDGTVGGSNKFGFSQIDFYYNPETKKHRMNVKDIDYEGKVLFEYNAVKSGEGSIPQPTEAKAVLSMPDLAKPLDQNVPVDARGSIGDTVEIKETTSEGITLKNTGDPLLKQFDVPDKNNFSIGMQVTAKKANSIRQVSKQISIQSTGPQPGGKVLYDSNIHGKWNNGQKRVVDEGDGDQGPNGKGLHTAASGDPRLTIEGDGVSHLESSRWGRIYIYVNNYNGKLKGMFMFETDHGKDDNISIKMRSRHGNNNHPQGGSNEFGGLGFAFHPDGEIGIKAEIIHGGSSYDFGNLQAPPFKLGQWYEYGISYFDASDGSINVSVEVDGKLIGSKKWANPPSSAKDKAAFAADSYFWVRLNCHDGDRAKAAMKDLLLTEIAGA